MLSIHHSLIDTYIQLAGARFIGRCILSNWQLEVPEICKEAYDLVVVRHMFDGHRRGSLASLARPAVDPQLLHFQGFPWRTGIGDHPNEPLEAAMSKYRKMARISREQWPVPVGIPGPKPFLRDCLPQLVEACHQLKSGKAVMEEVAELVQLHKWMEDVVSKALGEMQWMAGDQPE